MKSPAKHIPKIRFSEFSSFDPWKAQKLDSCLEPVSREVVKPTSKYLGLGLRSYGKGTFLKENVDPETNSMERLYEVAAGDLIVNITFAWEGAIAIAGEEDDKSLVSHRFPTYRIKNNKVLSGFLRHVIRRPGFVYSLGLISPGGAGRNRVMSKKDFLELSVLVPDMPEQQRISDTLEALDNLIEAETDKLDAFKDHKQGLMQQLFPAEGESLPALRFPEFSGAAIWNETTLGSIIELISGLHLSPADYSETGAVPYFTGPSDFTHNVEQVVKWTDKTANVANAGDIVITVKGSGVGELLDLGLTEVALGRQLMAVRAHACETPFLFQFLQTRRSEFVAMASGNLIPGLSRNDILGMKLYLPQPEEQMAISNCLSSVGTLISSQQSRVEGLKKHKLGLLQQLFPVFDEVER